MHPFFHRFSRHDGGDHGRHGHPRPPLAGPGRHEHGGREAFDLHQARGHHHGPHHGHAHEHGPHRGSPFGFEAGFDAGFDTRHGGRIHCHDPRGGDRGGRGPGRGGFDGPRGGRGGGGFDDLRGGRGRGGPRPLGHGDLRLLMLHLIAEQPRHGYELIRLIEDLFHGAYSPSPGAIYPTLSQLEDMGLIAATAEEGRKRYAITDEGRAHVQAEHERIEAARQRTHRSARDIAKAQIPPPVREAFGRIKHAVLSRHGQWSEAEIARFAALLNEAADGIEAGTGTGDAD